MIYLLTQMILCLALAALAGGAAGWLLHRARAGAEDEALRETIVRQHHQLRHAETDVAMLTDDFDDLKQRSQTEIESLRRDVRRLPALLQNLEKSQTLVRQLMQKHEAQLREAAQQNETLRARLVGHDEREAAFARARSELETARAELLALRGGPAGAGAAAIGSATAGAAPANADATVTTAADDDGRAVADGSEDADASRGAGTPSVFADSVVPPIPAASPSTGAPGGSTDTPASADRGRAPVDPPRFDRSGFGLDLDALVGRGPPERGRRSFLADAPSEGDVAADAVPVVDADADELDVDATVVIAAADRPVDPGPSVGSGSEGRADAGAADAPTATGADDPFGTTRPGERAPEADDASGELPDPDLDDADHALDDPGFDDDLDGLDDEDEDPLDDSVELLFEPVDRHDDLQRIFGIGPVTERALNRLGITSYSQLAELDRDEVEQIADALQIYPGRIERDDWVGNARRQLEDVLEEL